MSLRAENNSQIIAAVDFLFLALNENANRENIYDASPNAGLVGLRNSTGANDFNDFEARILNLSTWNITGVDDLTDLFVDNRENTLIAPTTNVFTQTLIDAKTTEATRSLAQWDVSAVNNFTRTFKTSPANNDSFMPTGISEWSVGGDGTFAFECGEMFENSRISTENLSGWKMQQCTDLTQMFLSCSNFVGNGLYSWQISENLTSLRLAFKEANLAPGLNLGSWDVSGCTLFNGAFGGNANFIGRGLRHWDVSSGTDFSNMFAGCNDFDENVQMWKLDAVAGNTLIDRFVTENYPFISPLYFFENENAATDYDVNTNWFLAYVSPPAFEHGSKILNANSLSSSVERILTLQSKTII